ncbi:MAG: hypothetical protein ACXWVH_03520, partial [Caulobacteraceae bacterium]
ILRYEDLVLLNEQAWAKLDAHLGFTSSRQGFGGVTTSVDRTSPFWTPLYEQGVSAGRIGAWRESLSGDDKARVEAVFAYVMSQFGYGPAQTEL